jgi:hypothetical protein
MTKKDAKAEEKKMDTSYLENLRAPIVTAVGEKPKARVHSREWAKIMAGEPVEINPSVGYGFKIMTVDEWSARWKKNDDIADCLNCGSLNTKEHHFTQASTIFLRNISFPWCSVLCEGRGRLFHFPGIPCN